MVNEPMESLIQQSCEACRADAPKISDEDLKTLMPQIPDWGVIVVDGIMQLQREFGFDNFEQPPGDPDRVGQGDRHLVEPQDPGIAQQRPDHGGAHGRGIWGLTAKRWLPYSSS
jgi:hypothetical protein